MSARPLKRMIQKGFTLIELIIVVVILGILTTIVATQFTGGVTDASRAQALYESAQKLASSWQILNQICGTPEIVTNSPLPNGGNGTSATDLNILFNGPTSNGTQNIDPKYTGCYTTSGLKPLSDIAQYDTSSGTWKIQNAAVSMADGSSLGASDAGKMVIEYASVPDTQVLALVTKYGDTAKLQNGQLPAGGDTTDNNIQYTSGSNGARTLYILRSL